MSTSLTRQIGSFIGGSVAGPAGAIIGGIATSILGEATGIDDSIGDAIGGVVGDQAGTLLGRLSPEEKQQINHDLQTAFQDAFCEALYDIGGEACFPQAWKSSERDVPLEVVYPKSVGHQLWTRQDPLAAQLCECLHQIEQAVDELLPLEPPADNLAANVERYLEASTPQALADEFFTQILASYLTQFRVLFLEVNNFEPHLRRHLFNRLLIHLGEHLKQRTEAWRAFNRFVLEEIRLRVRALGAVQSGVDELRDEQRSMSQKQEELRMWSERIEQQLAQQPNPLERAVLEEALTALDRQIRQHFEQMSHQMAAGFAQVRQIQEQIDTLPERIRTLLGEVTERLETQATLASYLEAVIGACDTIYLPYSQEGEASLPLERVYVALRADRSSPVERRASNKLFRQLVREQTAQFDTELIYQVAALNPYAARYLLYDELRAALRSREEEEERTYHLAEIVRTHRWLVLLGHPGSGKSTLARWLALQLARAMQAGQAEVSVRASHVRPSGKATEEEALGMARLPVVVRIADYAAARWQEGVDNQFPLRNYLGRHISQLLEQSERKAALYALLDDYLAQGRVCFILDGLDEVTDAQQRNLIVAQIEDLIRDHVCDAQGKNPLDNRLPPSELASARVGNQLIVTSRIVGYQLRPLHENLPHFVIQPMDKRAVRRFCDNWVAAKRLGVEGEALAKAVLEHSNPYVKEQMGRNPLLLTILAQVFSANPQEGLPARRTLLYRQAKEAVFKQRPNQWGRLAQEMGGRDLERALERITAYLAFQLHANPAYPNSLVDERQAKRWLQAALKREPALTGERRLKDVSTDLLQAAANLSGFFVARGEGVYGFLHRQFQEYFAALWLVEQGLEEGLCTPFFERFANPNWQEVLFLTVGSLAEEDEREASVLLTHILDATHLDPTNGLLPHNALFVAAAMRERERWPKPLVKRVATALIQAYRRDDDAHFEAVRYHVQQAFNGLPRPHGRLDPVGDALIAALGKRGQAERFTRLAAAELIIESKWYTKEIARALSDAWQDNAEPAGTIHLALQVLYEADQTFFASQTKQLRRKLAPHWQTIERHAHWQAVIRALYLTPSAELTPEAIIRDSSLTSPLLRLLQEAPADRGRLVSLLQTDFAHQTSNEVTKRDTGLALVYLGDTSIVPLLLASPEQPFQKAILITITSARAEAHGDALTDLLADAFADAQGDTPPLALALADALADAHADAREFADALADPRADAAPLALALTRAVANAGAVARTLARRLADLLAHAQRFADVLTLARLLALADTRALAHTLKRPLALTYAGICARDLTKVITELQEQARTNPDEQIQAELVTAFSDVQATRDLLQAKQGVLDVWEALAEAWQAGEGRKANWLGCSSSHLPPPASIY